jgi:hypothetical protein
MSREQGVDHLPEILPKPRRRRWGLWVGMTLLLFLGLALLYAFYAYWLDRGLREAMAAADRDSPGGWQLEDIEAHREQIHDEENAALVILKVKRLLPANWPFEIAPSDQNLAEDQANSARAGVPPPTSDGNLNELPPEVKIDAALLRSLRASLVRIQPVRAEARKLIGMTRGRFPLKWEDDILLTKVNSEDARIAASLLRDEATLASQDGDVDSAVAWVRGMLGAARAVGDEPMLRSALVRFDCDAQAVQALERVLAQGEPSTHELEAVQALLEKEAAEPLFLQAVRGERASIHKLLLCMRHGTTDLSELDWLRGFPRPRKSFLDYFGPTLARHSHAHTLALMNQYVEAAKLPPEKQPPVMRTLEQKVRKAKADWAFVTARLMPAMNKVSNSYRRSVGNLRSASVAVALERYRRDHGGWPDSLDALVPKYLAVVPKDPQDGRLLRFTRRQDGVIIYWIGLDGIDDGGKLNRRYPWAQGRQGFQLWDVKQRRQPVRELLPQPAEERTPTLDISRAAAPTTLQYARRNIFLGPL